MKNGDLRRDIADEREGVKTYGAQATKLRRKRPKAAQTLTRIQGDERRHLKTLKRLRRSR